jgi:hypothetical protein
MGAVKKLRIGRGRIGLRVVLATALMSGCATHVIGVVEPTDPGTMLTTSTGQHYRLALGREASPMRWLDGHMAEVSGPRVGRRIQVKEWKVIEGLHGLPVWVGVLEARGVQIGLHDRNSGAYYFVDQDAVDTLWPFLGEPVLLEGYVEGAHRVRVVYFRVLADNEPENAAPGGSP